MTRILLSFPLPSRISCESSISFPPALAHPSQETVTLIPVLFWQTHHQWYFQPSLEKLHYRQRWWTSWYMYYSSVAFKCGAPSLQDKSLQNPQCMTWHSALCYQWEVILSKHKQHLAAKLAATPQTSVITDQRNFRVEKSIYLFLCLLIGKPSSPIFRTEKKHKWLLTTPSLPMLALVASTLFFLAVAVTDPTALSTSFGRLSHPLQTAPTTQNQSARRGGQSTQAANFFKTRYPHTQERIRLQFRALVHPAVAPVTVLPRGSQIRCLYLNVTAVLDHIVFYLALWGCGHLMRLLICLAALWRHWCRNQKYNLRTIVFP